METSKNGTSTQQFVEVEMKEGNDGTLEMKQSKEISQVQLQLSNTSSTEGAEEEFQRERFSIFKWSPDLIQPLASPKFFLLLSVLEALLSGLLSAGWDSSLSSICRRFRMPFGLIGTIRGLAQLGGFVALPLFAHYGGAGHRPKWIGFALTMQALGCFIVIAPELFTPSLDMDSSSGSTTLTIMNETLAKRLESSSAGVCVVGDDLPCEEEAQRESWSTLVFIAFVIGHTLMDGATSGSTIVKHPYYYDNVKAKNFPLYLGIDMFFYFAGLGFGLGCMFFLANIYYRPWSVPVGVAPGDPQWISAWYIPVTMGAIGQLVLAVFYMGFPRQLRKTSPVRRATLTQLPRDMWRLVCNRIFLFIAIGRGIDYVIIQQKVALLKYVEEQFRMTPARTALYLSTLGLGVTAGANLLGSIGISRWRPTPRAIMLAIFGSQAISIALTAVQGHIQCETQPIIVGQSVDDVHLFNFTSTCNAQCQCSDDDFQPVCDRSLNINYFSPCRAGCPSPGEATNGTNAILFSNCSCLAESTAERGWCQGECSAGLVYILVHALLTVVAFIPLTGNVMILYLVVESELKSQSMALITLFQTVMMPGGILVTMLFDSACARWAGEGGRCTEGSATGNCLVFDRAALRLRFHYFGVLIQLLGELSDAYVLYRVWNMTFPDEGKQEEKETEARSGEVVEVKKG